MLGVVPCEGSLPWHLWLGAPPARDRLPPPADAPGLVMMPARRCGLRPEPDAVPCRYFLRGCCRFGAQCRFSHSRQPRAENGKPPAVARDWADAPEFIPSTSSKADAAHNCPYLEKSGICKYRNTCRYMHYDVCELCSRPALHPSDEELRKQHTQDCIKQHEADMELSFAVARSKEKSCGVCFEVIMEKSSRERRFGILPNCNHCFCLTCIRKWRQARQFDNKIIRACPECRVTSDFVCPSMYWVDTKEEKEKLIVAYKVALSKKNCKYFYRGRGHCPFGNKCFYLHALPDGTKKDVGPPVRNRVTVSEVDFDVLQQLSDILDCPEEWMQIFDFYLERVFTDSDEQEWSDY